MVFVKLYLASIYIFSLLKFQSLRHMYNFNLTKTMYKTASFNLKNDNLNRFDSKTKFFIENINIRLRVIIIISRPFTFLIGF